MNHESTLDAFLDGETIEPSALDAALADPVGRSYLIDALALRQLMADAPIVIAVRANKKRLALLTYARAAAIAFALVGLGYAAGSRLERVEPGSEPVATQISDAPEPTRLIELKPGVNWHESKGGD